MRKLRISQLVVIDNVAAYYYQDLEKKLKDGQELKVADFPNVMLPFETAFLEMRVRNNPSFEATFEECGILARMYKPESLDYSKISAPANVLEFGKSTLFHKDVAYHLICLFFVNSKQVGKPSFTASFTVPVNHEGRIVSLSDTLSVIGDLYFPDNVAGQPVDKQTILFYLIRTYLSPCLLALSFMHCRNVKVVDEVPPPKLSKKHQKKTGKPLLKFKVLQIDHMKEILERQGAAASQGLKHALHICRGHFKTYGKDGKGLLFGKHIATVWVPMHTRGSMEEGIVVKDYEVE